MAEALARHFGGDTLQVASAGLRPGSHLAEHTRDVLQEIHIELADHHPQPLEAVEGPVDCVISLCEVIRPGLDLFPKATRYCWRIPDPVGGSLEDYRKARDLIWKQLRPLLFRLTEKEGLPERLDSAEPSSP